MIFSLVGRVPQRGELIRHPGGLEFEIIDADPRRVKKIRIHLIDPIGPDDGHKESPVNGAVVLPQDDIAAEPREVDG